MIKLNDKSKIMTEVANAIMSKDSTKIENAYTNMFDSIADVIKSDYEEFRNTNDKNVLASRGYRELTSKEEKFYNHLVNCIKTNNIKNAFTTFTDSDAEDIFPQTILEDVFRNLKENHPLLSKVNIQNVGFTTKWILNKHSRQLALWGAINSEITKEITDAFEVIDLKQNKLSCFAIISNDMLELGAVFLDAYIRTCLEEAMAFGLENAIINGNGINMPIGMTKDIHRGVSVNDTTGYPTKTPVSVDSFLPKDYGELLANFAKTENGATRNFNKVTLIVNQNDYLTKIMPATTVLNNVGNYISNLFPYNTDVVVSNVLEDGKAILCIADEYFLGIGKSKKNDVIEISEEYRFLEDQTVFKVKQFADGRATDNTSCIYLDISNLDPAYITVQTLVNA